MKARASAVDELQSAGTFDDLTQIGPGKDDIDRQLEAIGAGGAVDDELSKMKAELAGGAGAQAALAAPAQAAAPDEAPAADATAEDAEPEEATPTADDSAEK
jgi:phage shock protein A